MISEGLDPVFVSKLTSQQVEQATCLECCKYYIAPETAQCGHTLCHGCWRGRRSCPACASPFDRRTLRLNIPLQTLTEHVHALGDAFEKLFNVKLDEFVLDTPDTNMEVEKDPSKNVKEWLASSQNHFSAPILSSQHSTQDVVHSVELSASKIQLHTNNKLSSHLEMSSHKKTVNPPKLTQHCQDDWDKIEVLSDTEHISNKNQENFVEHNDIEPYLTENGYTIDKPRRSSRKRDVKINQKVQISDKSTDNHSSKNSSTETDKKSLKAKQNWNNVKNMRKEFSKLNKKNRSKLNVSIEMCKKAQSITSKPVSGNPVGNSQQTCYIIDDNTPESKNTEKALKTKMNSDKNAENSNKSDIPESSKINVDNVNSYNKENIGSSFNEKVPSEVNINKVRNDNINCSSTNEYVPDKKNSFKDDCETKLPNMPIYKRSVLCRESIENDCIKITQNDINTGINTDDIEISIKVGSTVTNIVIKKKQQDVQLKLNTDRGIQTTIGPFGLHGKNDASCSPMTQVIEHNARNDHKIAKIPSLHKSICTKKNTDSADTATANFEITESVEKELSDLMECVETACIKNKNTKVPSNMKCSQIKNTNNGNEVPEELGGDLDIFNSGSVKEAEVQLLQNINHAPSEILMPALKSKKSQKVSDKRDRDINDETDVPSIKKRKIESLKSTDKEKSVNISTDYNKHKDIANDSEPMNYDAIMSQVFANIDADIKEADTEKTKRINDTIDNSLKHTQNTLKKHITETDGEKISNTKELINQKYSENVFSFLEKDNELNNIPETNNNQQLLQESTQQNINKLFTPAVCRDLTASKNYDLEMMEVQGTPLEDNDDSDKSVVEETPQKNISFSKLKQKSDSVNKNDDNKQQLQKNKSAEEKLVDSQIQSVQVINISDASGEFNKIKDADFIEIANKKQLETPLTINKFVDHIKHNSTPMARKSLNFDSNHLEDLEQTLCPTTTQEKEFRAIAFEHTPKNSLLKKPLVLGNSNNKDSKKFCLAGSCLNTVELSNIKILCHNRGWTYVEKYTKDLTHLVVGVDEENKSQRSVKYMCALAASKWIVAYGWVEKCLQTKSVVDELPYEALDGCGEPGPRRSRIAQKKLFEGFTFYCMSPFSILNLETLKEILEAAGGRVVNTAQEVRVTNDTKAPALLLAEPEHTQEDRFIYLAMELKIVPVNYEWVLNCLGTYSLGSLHELLLCPSTLLPEATKHWPSLLLQRETDDSDII